MVSNFLFFKFCFARLSEWYQTSNTAPRPPPPRPLQQGALIGYTTLANYGAQSAAATIIAPTLLAFSAGDVRVMYAYWLGLVYSRHHHHVYTVYWYTKHPGVVSFTASPR